LPLQKPEHHEHLSILVDALVEKNEVKTEVMLLA
jgi:hypothetical protein